MLIPIALTALTLSALQHQQEQQPPSTPPDQTAAQQAPAPRPDRAVDPSQPDFTLVGLPTTLRIPRFGSSFRVTHRFTRSLGRGDFGDLANDFFGFDASALIGLEYRFGLMSGTQVGIHRTNDEKTIEVFAQRQLLRQGGGSPVAVDALAAVEGLNNLRDHHSPSLGAVVSRSFGKHGAAYVEPIWVNNTNRLPKELADENSTFMIGVGVRARLRPTVYVVAEVTPRVSGFAPGANQASFALEKRAGGHSFQVNFSNGFATTLGQLARGGVDNNSWYIGFNISRKFF